MTSFTPGGLPFPDGTDYIVDGDNAIRALAEAIDGPIYANFKLAPIAGSLKPTVGGAVAFDGPRTGSDTSVLSADKTGITLAKTGVYRVDMHLGLGANSGGATQSQLYINGVGLTDSLVYGNTGTAGVFVAMPTAYVVAVGGTTEIKIAANAALGIYDWSWTRVTYMGRNR